MSDPSLVLQGAIVTALKAANVAGGRIYDRVPEGAAKPYVTVGEGQTIGNDNLCAGASEVFADVHVWSDAVGWPEAKTLVGQIRNALAAELALVGFTVTVAEFRQARFLPATDGLLRHAVLEFRYLIDHSA